MLTHKIRKLNQAGYDCIFINAPFHLPMKSTIEINGEKVEVDNGKRENAKAWFLYSDVDPADASLALTETPMPYVGLEESCALIGNIIKEEVGENEFCGLLGFSQGSVMVHILSAITCYSKISNIEEKPLEIKSALLQFHKIKCSILISGFIAMHNEPILPFLPSPITSSKSSLGIPSFHIIGTKDTSVSPELSKKLYSCFSHSSNDNILYHEKGHMIPQRSFECSKIIQFINDSNI